MSLANQAIKIVGGPLLILLVTLNLTETNQGLWFLFISLGSLSSMADLGFSNLILQTSAQEFGRLTEKKNTQFEDVNQKKRLLALLRFTIFRGIKASAFVFPLMFLVGMYFLWRDKNLDETMAWLSYVCATGVIFLNLLIIAYFEGHDKVTQANTIRSAGALAYFVSALLGLTNQLGLYSLSLAAMSYAIVMSSIVFVMFKRPIIESLSCLESASFIDERKIYQLAKRYGVSFASGYFIFSAYVPLMTYMYGTIEGGRVGLGLAVVTSIFGVSNIWISTIIPRMNFYVSNDERAELNAVFTKRIRLSLLTYLSVTALFLAAVKRFDYIEYVSRFSERMICLSGLLMLFACYFLQLCVNSLATYVRAHQYEPFSTPSLLQAVWVILGTYAVGNFFPVDYFFAGLLSSYIWWLPLSYYIYLTCKNQLNG